MDANGAFRATPWPNGAFLLLPTGPEIDDGSSQSERVERGIVFSELRETFGVVAR